MKKILLVLLAFSLTACATRNGARLYDKAVLEVTSENVLLLQQQIDQKFMRAVNVRLIQFSSDAVTAKGDMKVTEECGARTMKITQDIQSLSVGSLTEVRPGFWSSKSRRNDDVNVSIGTSISDCVTGEKIASYSYKIKSNDPFEALKSLAHTNVSVAYRYRNAP